MSTHSRGAIGADNHKLDELTRASSRRDFLAELEAAKGRADTEAVNFVLCLIDVDQLRNVNDRHGQDAGDAILRELAERTSTAFALPQWQAFSALVARFDGDSLIVLLRGARLRDGEQLAEELRRRVAREPFAGELRMTISLAVTAYRSGESIDALLARTEQTLHLAKQFGCDCVEIARTPEMQERHAADTPSAEADFTRLRSRRKR
jgi:diguanylate cyclase (GGDEF)-like protein